MEKAVMENTFQNNQKILYLVKYSIDYMDEMVKNLCMSVYLNREVVPLITNADTDFVDSINTINKLKASVVDTNTCLHSILFI